MLNTIILISFSIVLPFVVTALMWKLYFSPSLGVILILLIFLLETINVAMPGVKIGISIYPHDIVFLLLSVPAAIRFIQIRKLNPAARVWIVIGLLILISFIKGIPRFGTTAGVEFRPYFFFWMGGLYFSTFQLSPDDIHKINRALILTVLFLLLIAVYRWISDGLGLSNFGNIIGAGKMRVLNATQTHFITVMLCYVFYTRRMSDSTTFWKWLTPLLALFILVLQHRTLWVVTTVSVALGIVLDKEVRRLLSRRGTLALIIACVVVVPFVAYGHLDNVIQSLDASYNEAVSMRHNTFTWRLQSWIALLTDWLRSGPIIILFGNPFGSGYSRYIADLGHKTNYAPHNYYVECLLRVGVTGLLILVFTYVSTIFKHFQISKINQQVLLPSNMIILFLVGHLVYFVTYAPHFVQSIFLGLSLSLLNGSENNNTVKGNT